MSGESLQSNLSLMRAEFKGTFIPSLRQHTIRAYAVHAEASELSRIVRLSKSQGSLRVARIRSPQEILPRDNYVSVRKISFAMNEQPFRLA